MKGLLIAAHGSRKKPSNEEVLLLTKQIQELAEGEYDMVVCGFVQFALPDVESQIEALVDAGITTIVLLPYFLGAGSHVSGDIPQLVRNTQSRYPKVDIKVTAHLGRLEGLAKFIFDRVKEL